MVCFFYSTSECLMLLERVVLSPQCEHVEVEDGSVVDSNDSMLEYFYDDQT